MMRELVRNLMISDASLVGYIPAERWLEGGSVVDTPDRPFAIMRLSGTFRGLGPIQKGRVEFRVHDERGNFETIDAVIRRIKAVMEPAEQVQTHGAELIRAEWLSDSPDLYDDGFRTNMRSTGFDLTGKGF